jgi:hypothetical protein
LQRRQWSSRDFGQTKIQDLRLTAFGQKQIRRFQVTMDDARRVSDIERIRNLHGEIQKLFQRERLALDAVIQRRPFQAFHDNEETVLVFADVVDGADVWMIQGRRRARFPAEIARA